MLTCSPAISSVNLYFSDPLPTSKIEYLANAFSQVNFFQSTLNFVLFPLLEGVTLHFLIYEEKIHRMKVNKYSSGESECTCILPVSVFGFIDVIEAKDYIYFI